MSQACNPNEFSGEWCLDGAIDRLLDGGVDGEMREKLIKHVRSDHAGREELVGRASAVNLLRDPVPSPDLSGAILHKVERRIPFMPEWLRKAVVAGRLAACIAVLAGLLTVAIVVRLQPGLLTVPGEQAALLQVSSAVASDAAESRREAQQLGAQAQQSLFPSIDSRAGEVAFTRGGMVIGTSSGLQADSLAGWSAGVQSTGAAVQPVEPGRGSPLLVVPVVASGSDVGPVADNEPLP